MRVAWFDDEGEHNCAAHAQADEVRRWRPASWARSLSPSAQNAHVPAHRGGDQQADEYELDGVPYGLKPGAPRRAEHVDELAQQAQPPGPSLTPNQDRSQPTESYEIPAAIPCRVPAQVRVEDPVQSVEDQGQCGEHDDRERHTLRGRGQTFAHLVV